MAAVQLILEVPASGITSTGALVGFNDESVESLQRQDGRVVIESMWAGDDWLNYAAWQAAGYPAYQRVRVRVRLDNKHTPMTPRVVGQLTKMVQTILDNHETPEPNINAGPSISMPLVGR